MSKTRRLPVLMPSVAGQRWSCHSCARCCYDAVVHLSSKECRRIDEQDWGDSLGMAPYVRMGDSTVLNKHDSGACVFLDQATKRCRIHEKFGGSAKPLACRIYPFTVRDVRGGWQVSLRFDCPSVASSDGVPIDEHRSLIEELARELVHDAPADDDCPDITPGLRATEDETQRMIERFVGWFEDRQWSIGQRLAGAASVSEMLSRMDFAKVRGRRLAELVDVLFTSAGLDHHEVSVDLPSARQLGLLRELAFAHAEHASIADMSAGRLQKAQRKLAQLGVARRLRRGKGFVPLLRGTDSVGSQGGIDGARAARNVDFAVVERIRAADSADQISTIDDLIVRYVAQRMRSRTVFGRGYYDRAMFDGMRAFWASIVAVGWLSRLFATAAGRSALTYEDVFEGLRIVDRAAGRAPVLASRSERLRLSYLARDDGLTKLLHHYALAAR